MNSSVVHLTLYRNTPNWRRILNWRRTQSSAIISCKELQVMKKGKLPNRRRTPLLEDFMISFWSSSINLVAKKKTSLNDNVFSCFLVSFQVLETLVCERAFPINLCVLVCFHFHLGSQKYWWRLHYKQVLSWNIQETLMKRLIMFSCIVH